jgi:hypothetical protein
VAKTTQCKRRGSFPGRLSHDEIMARFFGLFQKESFMKNLTTIIYFISLLFLATSCELIGDIFGAGVYTGIFIVIFVIVLILVIVAKIFRR